MVLGVIIGLVAGLAAGLVWHLVRQCGRAGGGADGRGAAGRRPGGLDGAGAATAGGGAHGRGGAETARAVLASELELLKKSDERRAEPAPRTSASGWRGPSPSCRPQALQKNNEQFLALAETKLSQAQTAAQGDLTQRQQAIAQLLGPAERDPGPLRVGPAEDRGGTQGRLRRPEREGGAAASRATSSCRRRRAIWSPRCARRRPGAAGERSSCGGWWRWPGCWRTATSTSRSRPSPMTVVSGPT